ncbi:MAG: hypothetical protein FIA92_10030 [Chloroflexi bacterium]|nr:hypothetical protein [Chloroflexota bacterium]
MKAILELLPIGAAAAVVSGITWFMLDRDIGLGKWALAGLLLAHGWVHMMYVFPTPETATATAGGLAYPFDLGRSWLVTNVGLDAGLVRIVGIALMLVTLAGFVLAALATVGILVPSGWWAGLVLGAAATSTVLLILTFSPALLLGFGINAALWVLVLASVWSPVAGPLAR